MALLWLVQAAILFVPESTWTMLGIDANRNFADMPAFIQYYVGGSDFGNAMFVFWITSPVFFALNTMLFLAHLNGAGYAAFLQRRTSNLKKQGKSSNLGLVAQALVFAALYVWGTAIYLKEPTILGSQTPVQSRLMMLIVHMSALGVVFPAFLTFSITELRAIFFPAE